MKILVSEHPKHFFMYSPRVIWWGRVRNKGEQILRKFYQGKKIRCTQPVCNKAVQSFIQPYLVYDLCTMRTRHLLCHSYNFVPISCSISTLSRRDISAGHSLF